MIKSKKLLNSRLDYMTTVIHQCFSIKVPLFVLRKFLKVYLKKQDIDINVMEEKNFKLLVEQIKNFMLKIESEI